MQYVPGELPHIELERKNGDEALERVLCVFKIPSLLGLAGYYNDEGKLNQHAFMSNPGIFIYPQTETTNESCVPAVPIPRGSPASGGR